MGSISIRVIESVPALRQVADAWDDLWLRSDVTTPISQAELVALRAEHIGGAGSFRGLVAEQDGRFIAALPLVNRRLKGVLRVGSLPGDYWFSGGAFLFDPHADCASALDALMPAVNDLGWPLLWLTPVAYESAACRAIRSAAGRAGLSVSVREHFQIGEIEIGGDWEGYKARMKGDHRRKLNRYVRKLDEAGGAELTVHRDVSPEQAEELTRRAFEIEDRSWKGTEGTSVLRNPAAFGQYVREARALAARGQLEIAFLEQRGRPIAFIFGYSAKGVLYSTKLGYDEEFAKFGPGQQLMLRLLENFHADASRRRFDFAGPLVSFHQVWATGSYSVGPLVIGIPSLLGRSLFHAYTEWQPKVKRIRRRVAESLAGVRAAASAGTAKIRQVAFGYQRPAVSDQPISGDQ